MAEGLHTLTVAAFTPAIATTVSHHSQPNENIKIIFFPGFQNMTVRDTQNQSLTTLTDARHHGSHSDAFLAGKELL